MQLCMESIFKIILWKSCVQDSNEEIRNNNNNKTTDMPSEKINTKTGYTIQPVAAAAVIMTK